MTHGHDVQIWLGSALSCLDACQTLPAFHSSSKWNQVGRSFLRNGIGLALPASPKRTAGKQQGMSLRARRCIAVMSEVSWNAVAWYARKNSCEIREQSGKHDREIGTKAEDVAGYRQVFRQDGSWKNTSREMHGVVTWNSNQQRSIFLIYLLDVHLNTLCLVCSQTKPVESG